MPVSMTRCVASRRRAKLFHVAVVMAVMRDIPRQGRIARRLVIPERDVGLRRWEGECVSAIARPPISLGPWVRRRGGETESHARHTPGRQTQCQRRPQSVICTA
jgi:hypothetical protein